MIIAINTNHFSSSIINDLLDDHWLNFAASSPQHQFVFIVPLSPSVHKVIASNITVVVSAPRAANRLLWTWWLNFTLPPIAKKHGASLVIHLGAICSLRSKLPQCMLVSDLSYVRFPQFISGRQLQFLKKYMPLFVAKTNTIAAPTGYLAKEILENFPGSTGKITTIPLAPGELFKPLDGQEKELIKEQYTSGKEYFLFSGEIQPRYHLVNLLKAFTFFKTRQKSNMQLIITAPAVSEDNAFLKSFNSYKYRKEVSILFNPSQDELAKLTGAAYASIYPATGDGTAILPLQAMQCKVPIISTTNGALYPLAGDAALYINPDNFEDIAAKMMLVFKDELKRSELISAATKSMQHINNDNSNALWDKLILETAKANH